MSHADRGWGRQAESLGDRRLTSMLRDLLSAEIQSAQFADLLVRDLDDDDRTGMREGNGQPRQASRVMMGQTGLLLAHKVLDAAHGQAAAPSFLKGTPRRQRPQAVLRS